MKLLRQTLFKESIVLIRRKSFSSQHKSKKFQKLRQLNHRQNLKKLASFPFRRSTCKSFIRVRRNQLQLPLPPKSWLNKDHLKGSSKQSLVPASLAPLNKNFLIKLNKNYLKLKKMIKRTKCDTSSAISCWEMRKCIIVSKLEIRKDIIRRI